MIQDPRRRDLRAARATTVSLGMPGITARLTRAFPGLLGPGRRAAWRRYCVRRGLSVSLILLGFGLAVLIPR